MQLINPFIIFDSGLGGLSILKHLLDLPLPLIYYADQANFPYGDKSDAWLRTRLQELSQDFVTYDPSGILIACNTATTMAITDLRSTLKCPIFGVEPVIKMLKNHVSPVVWGTKATLSSNQTNKLISMHNPGITKYTPNGLANAIEQEDRELIASCLSRARSDLGRPDAIGLSCTHYPLIIDQIQSAFPDTILYDPSVAVAAHIKTSLGLNPSSAPPKITYISTSSVLRLEQVAERYLV